MFSHIVFPVHEWPKAPSKKAQKEFQADLTEAIAMFHKSRNKKKQIIQPINLSTPQPINP